MLLEDDYHQHGLHKNSEAKENYLILQLLPPHFSIEHVRGHQDTNKKNNKLDIRTQLNIDADTIATKTVSLPINKHAIVLPFILNIRENTFITVIIIPFVLLLAFVKLNPSYKINTICRPVCSIL